MREHRDGGIDNNDNKRTASEMIENTDEGLKLWHEFYKAGENRNFYAIVNIQ